MTICRICDTEIRTGDRIVLIADETNGAGQEHYDCIFALNERVAAAEGRVQELAAENARLSNLAAGVICPRCGGNHELMGCRSVKFIEYNGVGDVLRVEFFV